MLMACKVKSLSQQRDKNRYMTEERVAALDKIGMIWNVPDYIWEEIFSAALRYHRENGDLNVPANYVDDEGISLGQWICGLRSNRNGTAKNGKPLTDEQIARLDAIGMRWGSKYDRQWDEAFDALCSYHNKHLCGEKDEAGEYRNVV